MDSGERNILNKTISTYREAIVDKDKQIKALKRTIDSKDSMILEIQDDNDKYRTLIDRLRCENDVLKDLGCENIVLKDILKNQETKNFTQKEGKSMGQLTLSFLDTFMMESLIRTAGMGDIKIVITPERWGKERDAVSFVLEYFHLPDSPTKH